MPNQSTKHMIIRKSYIRLLLVNIAALAATNMCVFIDNLMISRYLGTVAQAAIGYFAPLSVLTGLAYVIITGTAILCGNLIGAGRHEKVQSLFRSACLTILLMSSLLSLILIGCRGPLSSLLGARDDAQRMLQEYMTGFSPSIPFSSITALFMSLASYNNATNRTYIASFVMLLGNILLDAVLVKPMGVFGIGLATTLSSILSFAVLLPVYAKKNNTIHYEKSPIEAGLLIEATRRGLPNLLFIAGMMIKNSLINYSLSACIGYQGIAVANVLASFCSILGTFSGGISNSFSTLASLYYGEEDREAFIDVTRTSLRFGIVSISMIVAGMIIFSEPLACAYFHPGTIEMRLAQTMFTLGFLFFPINVFIHLIMQAYKAQGRMMLVNILSFLEVAMTGVFAALFAPRMGTSAVWLANTWSDLLAAVLILASAFAWKHRFSLRLQDILKLPDNFGAAPDEYAEYAVSGIKDVTAVSQSVIDFCKARGNNKRIAVLAGLCIEEIAGNIFQHGISHSRHILVNVRIVCKKNLIIRVWDDCHEFNPRERMHMYNPTTPEKNIGLRIVAGMTKDIEYYNNAGINTLIMKME